MNTETWPFADPPSVAVFIDRKIIQGESWIYYVGHDDDDGAWQFHGPDGFADVADAKVVSLKTVLELEPAIAALADLPLGWCAWREAPDAGWQRERKPTSD